MLQIFATQNIPYKRYVLSTFFAQLSFFVTEIFEMQRE